MQLSIMLVDILSSLPLDLIITNRAPSEAELRSARQMLPYLQQEISDISAQILEVAERLRRLESSRRTLQRKEARLKSVVAPIRRVPEDVICLLFDYCVREYCALDDDLGEFLPLSVDDKRASEHSVPFLSARNLPLCLTHVSRTFRRLVLAMPTLWRFVKFNIQSPTLSAWSHHDSNYYKDMCISRRNQISGMYEWLLRSALDLEVHISFSPHYNTDNRDLLHNLYDAMIDIVISCCTRWRDVEFSFDRDPPETLISALSALNSEDLPFLRTLRFRSYGYKTSGRYVKFMPMFSCSSLKTGVALDGLHIYKDILGFSFSNLTLLDACIETYDITVAKTLRQCTSLIDLRLLNTGENEYISIPGYVIELPCLQKLYVLDDALTAGTTIQYMITPGLNTFYYIAPWSHITTLPVIFKRTPNLTMLGLSVILSCALFLDILRYCPQIQCLDGLPSFRDSVPDLAEAYDKLRIRLVDADDAGDLICPKLQVMNAENQVIPIVNFNTLYSIVTRKSTPTSANLAPWKMLRAKIKCKREDEMTVRKLLRKCNRNIFGIVLSGVYNDDDA